MRLFFKFTLPVACLFLWVGSLPAETKPAAAKDSKESGKKKDKNKKSGESPKEAEKLAFPVPVGHDAKGLTLPSFGPDGKKKMNFTIGVANRVDEKNVEMQSLQVETFDEDGGPELNIQLPTSTFNLSTKILTTRQEVTITRDDFQLTGKTMEFNTETREGRLGGGVKMVIFNLDTTPNSEGDPEVAPPKPTDNVPKVDFPGADKKPSIKVNPPKKTIPQEPKPRE